MPQSLGSRAKVDQCVPYLCWFELQEAGAGQHPVRWPFKGSWYFPLGNFFGVGVFGVGFVQLEAQGAGLSLCLGLLHHYQINA